MKASIIYSTLSKLAKSQEKSFDDTSLEYRPVWTVRLHCGCTMTELVNEPQTRTYIDFSRHRTCERSRHFTGQESGWPQIADARKATTLPLDAWFAKSDDTEATAESAPESPTPSDG